SPPLELSGQHLFGVSRNRIDLLPYYGRLVAVLGQYFKDMAPLLVGKLEKEFEQLQGQRDQFKVEGKTKNVRFLAELVRNQLPLLPSPRSPQPFAGQVSALPARSGLRMPQGVLE